MAQSFKLSFVLVLVAYLGSGRAAHISLPSYHEETLLTPEERGSCAGNPCGEGATCQRRFDSRYVCLCIGGDFYDYDVKSCTRGKVFRGQIIMRDTIYNNSYADKTSSLFWDISSKIMDDIKLVLSAPPDGFINSTVLNVKEYKPQTWPFEPLGVKANVEVIYNTSADITTEMVKDRIDSANCTSCPGYEMGFNSVDLCKYDNRYPCGNETTATCSSVDGSVYCSCKAGYIPLTDRKCIEGTTTVEPTTTTGPTSITPDNTPTPTAGPTSTIPDNTPTPTEGPASTTPDNTPTPTADTTLGPTSTTPDNTPTPTEGPASTTPDNTPTPTAGPTSTTPDNTPTPTEGPASTTPDNTPTPTAGTTLGPTSTTPDNTPTPTEGPTSTTPTTTTITVCPDGQYLVHSKCVDCPFGFTGRNCSDPWLLILVIVGSVLGGLLLIVLILLPIVACISSGKCCRRTKNAKPDVPRIPRASAPRSWDTNSLEMSLRQGHSNPRYVHDNGRRFNY